RAGALLRLAAAGMGLGAAGRGLGAPGRALRRPLPAALGRGAAGRAHRDDEVGERLPRRRVLAVLRDHVADALVAGGDGDLEAAVGGDAVAVAAVVRELGAGAAEHLGGDLAAAGGGGLRRERLGDRRAAAPALREGIPPAD